MPIAVGDAERSRPIGNVLDHLGSSGRSSRWMESRVTEGTAALVRERVKVATSWFQMTRVYQTRDHVKNSFAGLWIVSPASKSVCRSSNSLPISMNSFNTRSDNSSIPNPKFRSFLNGILRHDRYLGELG
jgi:hypothetical protein